MISPRKWYMRRPGFIIPVFFCAFLQAPAQVEWNEALLSATGSCFVSNPSCSPAGNNQAALGTTKNNRLAVHHVQAMMLANPAIVALDLQFPAGGGGVGSQLASYGIPGYRFSSLWLSYGLRLHEKLFGGLGLHFFSHTISEKFLHNPGISFALGLQFRLSENLLIGSHVRNPLLWKKGEAMVASVPMMISVGFSYRFFSTALLNCELHFLPGKMQLCQGLEIQAAGKLKLLAGMHTGPMTISGGIRAAFKNWALIIALEHIYSTGLTPSSSLEYDW